MLGEVAAATLHCPASSHDQFLCVSPAPLFGFNRASPQSWAPALRGFMVPSVLSSLLGLMANPLGQPVLGQHGGLGCDMLARVAMPPVPKGRCCGWLQREAMGRAQVLGENMGYPELMCWAMASRKVPGQVSSNRFVQVRGALLQYVGLWISHQEPASPKQDIGTRSSRLITYGSWDCISNSGS